MAEMPRQLSQAEIDRILFLQSKGLDPRGRVPVPSIQNLRQQTSGTITPIDPNVAQLAAGGAERVGNFINKLFPNAEQLVAANPLNLERLFPTTNAQPQVTIPTGFNFAPKQAPTGEVMPGGLQSQQVNMNQLLSAIKPADVLGVSGAERAYTDVGYGRVPQPMDVAETLALGAGGMAAGKTAFKATKGMPVGMSIEDTSGLLQSTKPLFEGGWYHGTSEDIKEFRRDLLGEATKAKSAEEGFFFARDPVNPPKEMTQKSTDPETIALLKRLGKTDEEIAEMNTISMKGHGAHTASGYAQIGGDRDFREAMRNASLAAKKRDWAEHEKQVLIADSLDTSRRNQAQLLTAKHGEARDTMLSKIQSITASDPSFEKLMGYGWYNNPAQVNTLKKELINKIGKDKAADAIDAIDKYKSVTAERLADEVQRGANVMPVALRYKNPMYYDFKGSAYRDQTYADLVKEAKAKGHDALILQNTYDPGAGTAKLVDVGVVFDPAQIRSRFAKFDPANINSPDILAAGVPLGLLAGTEAEMPKKKQKK